VSFFWRKKVRNANDEGSSWKSAANKTRKIPFIKSACNNFDEKNETNPKRQKLSVTKYKKLTS
jgi:hypothetical protein